VVATVTGFDHPVTGIQIRIKVGSQYSGVPDTWRFEPGGCASGDFLTPEVPVGGGCPFLDGPHSIRFTDVQYSNGSEWLLFANMHDPVSVLPGSRYTVAQFQFDFSSGFDGLGLRPDSCGCLEQPQGIFLASAAWMDGDGNERSIWVNQECLGWEDPANSVSCPFFGCDLCGPGEPPPPHNPCADQQPTAAAWRSWGSIKASYR
jgi:hypothetical protein